ncbi:hypothetical protein, partial [Pseudomonas gessardii]|uniref:hypothetical protein n=1 Tax=Pseudomonas gessardii TaxID=78544 RepID=UPI001F23ADC1
CGALWNARCFIQAWRTFRTGGYLLIISPSDRFHNLQRTFRREICNIHIFTSIVKIAHEASLLNSSIPEANVSINIEAPAPLEYKKTKISSTKYTNKNSYYNLQQQSLIIRNFTTFYAITWKRKKCFN